MAENHRGAPIGASANVFEPRFDALDLGCVHACSELGPMLRHACFESALIGHHILDYLQRRTVQAFGHDARGVALPRSGQAIEIRALSGVA